ncbi:MAG TPA: GspH/FimT family pseudopilin [Noviherbaspirillum sp.]|jgi:type IV fimbrial biogenesis protein FimT|uniref:GspH/FimT family pseudopilin n=1 Tax=Noviherbaspirillum sp. TaxID=1926288 RepID=UPI002F944165
MKRTAGFTLVEMMIGVAIVAVLLTVAMPNFQAFIQNTQVRTAVENMQAGLNLARSEALRRNARVSFWIVDNLGETCARSASGTSWVVSFDDPSAACHNAASDSVVPRIIQTRGGGDGSPNVTVSAKNALAAAATCITFNGFGGAETTCGGGTPIQTVQFRAASGGAAARKLDIRITSGGAVRQCDPDVADSSKPAAC